MAVADGRIIATASGNEARYFITGHLGSVRTVLKADGTVVVENDFYPFGKRIPAGSPYLDFGARMYSPDCARWLSVDPMAEKYYGIGTHVYCAGDPVNIFDLQGRKIYFANGVRESFKGKFAEAVDYMNECGTSYNIAALEQSDQVYYVTEGEENRRRKVILHSISKVKKVSRAQKGQEGRLIWREKTM